MAGNEMFELLCFREARQSIIVSKLFKRRNLCLLRIGFLRIDTDEPGGSRTGVSLRGGSKFIPDPLHRPVHQFPVLVFAFDAKITVPAFVGVESLYDGSHEGDMPKMKLPVRLGTKLVTIVAHRGLGIQDHECALTNAQESYFCTLLHCFVLKGLSSPIHFGRPHRILIPTSASLYETSCKALIL